MQALAKLQSNAKIEIFNLSKARDTKILESALKSKENIINAQDAGTAYRFLTAFLAVTQQKKILIGTERMKERPIFPLVNALQKIGFDIKYMEKQGFPPLQFNTSHFNSYQNIIDIEANISSQFISALLMIAPLLPQGLTINLLGKISSKPYILMTLKQLEQFKIQYQWLDNQIIIPPQSYQTGTFTVEGDWSAASYWYAFLSVSTLKNLQLFLPHLFTNSLQGDSKIMNLMKNFGINTIFKENGILLEKTNDTLDNIEIDFSDCPDLAQTIAVVCVLKKIKATFKGIESLKIKETDRVKALQNELPKIGGLLVEKENNHYEIEIIKNFTPSQNIFINTYEDHRMCMSFAVARLSYPTIEIENKEAVAKSYPDFWKDENLFFEYLQQF
jgi:3-phosphoshikimate 1-carboxyvinyltransferase